MKAIFMLAACLIFSAAAYAQETPKPAGANDTPAIISGQSASNDAQNAHSSTDQTQQAGVYQVGGNVIAPKLIHTANPEFTEAARRDQAQGVVTVSLIIDAQGIPQNVKVEKSFRPDLDANAIVAVKQYRFQPATKNGVPVPVLMKININFRVYR